MLIIEKRKSLRPRRQLGDCFWLYPSKNMTASCGRARGSSESGFQGKHYSTLPGDTVPHRPPQRQASTSVHTEATSS